MIFKSHGKRTVTVRQFLQEREEWRKYVAENKGPDDVVHDPGDDIICDLCNDDIDINSVVQLVGDMALCNGCYERTKAENGKCGAV